MRGVGGKEGKGGRRTRSPPSLPPSLPPPPRIRSLPTSAAQPWSSSTTTRSRTQSHAEIICVNVLSYARIPMNVLSYARIPMNVLSYARIPMPAQPQPHAARPHQYAHAGARVRKRAQQAREGARTHKHLRDLAPTR